MEYYTEFEQGDEIFLRDIVPNKEKNKNGERTYSLVISKIVTSASGLEIPSQDKRIELYLGTRVDESPRFEDIPVLGVDEDGDCTSYDIPLLDKPINEERGESLADRKEAMKTLEEYAGWIGISDSTAFSRDQFDKLDRGISEEEDFPGQYL